MLSLRLDNENLSRRYVSTGLAADALAATIAVSDIQTCNTNLPLHRRPGLYCRPSLHRHLSRLPRIHQHHLLGF
jgi:hypothetical protein